MADAKDTKDTEPVVEEQEVKHFDGSVLKVNAEGDTVMSSFLEEGEELASDVAAREEAEASAGEAAPTASAGSPKAASSSSKVVDPT